MIPGFHLNCSQYIYLNVVTAYLSYFIYLWMLKLNSTFSKNRWTSSTQKWNLNMLLFLIQMITYFIFHIQTQILQIAGKIVFQPLLTKDSTIPSEKYQTSQTFCVRLRKWIDHGSEVIEKVYKTREIIIYNWIKVLNWKFKNLKWFVMNCFVTAQKCERSMICPIIKKWTTIIVTSFTALKRNLTMMVIFCFYQIEC